MINLRISTGSNLKGSAPLREVSSVYRAEPLMIAIIFMLETKYNCNNGHERDLIWLQSSSQKGPNTIAISVSNRTIYDCNLVQKRPYMIAMIEILFSRDSSSDSRQCNHIWSLLKQISILYGQLWIPLAIIFSRFFDQDCNHIWSTS